MGMLLCTQSHNLLQQILAAEWVVIQKRLATLHFTQSIQRVSLPHFRPSRAVISEVTVKVKMHGNKFSHKVFGHISSQKGTWYSILSKAHQKKTSNGNPSKNSKGYCGNNGPTNFILIPLVGQASSHTFGHVMYFWGSCCRRQMLSLWSLIHRVTGCQCYADKEYKLA